MAEGRTFQAEGMEWCKNMRHEVAFKRQKGLCGKNVVGKGEEE